MGQMGIEGSTLSKYITGVIEQTLRNNVVFYFCKFSVNITFMEQEIQDAVAKRRTFAIISHPDAGKTTLTEKLLLYSGMLVTAGMVKGYP